MIVSFTPRLETFQKLKEISPGKCDWLRLFHAIQQRSVRSCTFSLSLSLSLSSSFSVTCNSREDGKGVDPPQLSPARRKERRGRERRGREAVRWIEEEGRKGRGEGWVRRRNGIHFEIASHPVRSPFSTVYPPYPDTLPRPFPGSFPQEKPLPLLAPSRSLSPWLAPFRETACSPRILISSKVLFPLNRAATRNNALYVRVLRLSLPPSLRRTTFPLTLRSWYFPSCFASPSPPPFITSTSSECSQICPETVLHF